MPIIIELELLPFLTSTRQYLSFPRSSPVGGIRTVSTTSPSIPKRIHPPSPSFPTDPGDQTRPAESIVSVVTQ